MAMPAALAKQFNLKNNKNNKPVKKSSKKNSGKK